MTNHDCIVSQGGRKADIAPNASFPRVLAEGDDSSYIFSPWAFDCSGLNQQLGIELAAYQMCVSDSCHTLDTASPHTVFWHGSGILSSVCHWELRQHVLCSLCCHRGRDYPNTSHVRMTWLIWLMVDDLLWKGLANGLRVWGKSRACGSWCHLWIP